MCVSVVVEKNQYTTDDDDDEVASLMFIIYVWSLSFMHQQHSRKE